MRKSVLIVEDIDEIRKLVADLLHANGFTVFQAANGADAVIMLKNFHVDLVFSDVNMPKIDGIELFVNYRNIQPQAKFVLTSASSLPITFLDEFENEAIFISKPYNIQLVIEQFLELLRPKEEIFEDFQELESDSALLKNH